MMLEITDRFRVEFHSSYVIRQQWLQKAFSC